MKSIVWTYIFIIDMYNMFYTFCTNAFISTLLNIVYNISHNKETIIYDVYFFVIETDNLCEGDDTWWRVATSGD